MCSTPWCFGECDECLHKAKIDEENAESIKQCPYRKECNWETLDVKTDKCLTCGLITNY